MSETLVGARRPKALASVIGTGILVAGVVMLRGLLKFEGVWRDVWLSFDDIRGVLHIALGLLAIFRGGVALRFVAISILAMDYATLFWFQDRDVNVQFATISTAVYLLCCFVMLRQKPGLWFLVHTALVLLAVVTMLAYMLAPMRIVQFITICNMWLTFADVAVVWGFWSYRAATTRPAEDAG